MKINLNNPNNPDNPNCRRQFLKNISLATLSAGFLPQAASAAIGPKTAETAAQDCAVTTLDIYGEGPFYTSNAPEIENSQLAGPNEPGKRITISGRVYSADCRNVVPNTIIDVWHANDPGEYDNTGFNLRGVTRSNAQGFYLFETILPGKYLNGPSYRPAHIHFKIRTPDGQELITQLYFEGDTSIATDAAASMTSGMYDASNRIIALNDDGSGMQQGTWDIVLESQTMGVNDIYMDKGMIYSASPNPFSDEVVIRYGVFRESKVSILIYDLQGKLIANLDEQRLDPEKYEVVWRPDVQLTNGYYFAAIKINDLQVHYLKLYRQQ